MSSPVAAIALDSADLELILAGSRRGSLPTFSKLLREGHLTRLENTFDCGRKTIPLCDTETLWGMLQTGVSPRTSGFWATRQYQPDEDNMVYSRYLHGCNYLDWPPFYALGPDYSVAALNLVVSSLHKEINGIQLKGFAGHAPYVVPESRPASLFGELARKYGQNPLIHDDGGYPWNRRRILKLIDMIEESINQTTAIYSDLLGRREWDLFFGCYGELHSAGHQLWFAHDPSHPLHASAWGHDRDDDPLLTSYRQLDSALSELMSHGSPETKWVIFSLHGMQGNARDLCNHVFLPELLFRQYRKPMRGFGGYSREPGPQVIPHGNHKSRLETLWDCTRQKSAMFNGWPWNRSTANNSDAGLISPLSVHVDDSSRRLSALWYRRHWRNMKAFALPNFSEGHVRINLFPRHPEGTVSVDEYDAVCREVGSLLKQAVCGRTGAPIVEDVIRTRDADEPDAPERLHADLVVRWADTITDAITHPALGTIGPIPYDRPGEHNHKGFLIGYGPGIPAGNANAAGSVLDVGPTILDLMRAPIPAYFEGRPLLAGQQVAIGTGAP